MVRKTIKAYKITYKSDGDIWEEYYLSRKKAIENNKKYFKGILKTTTVPLLHSAAINYIKKRKDMIKEDLGVDTKIKNVEVWAMDYSGEIAWRGVVLEGRKGGKILKVNMLLETGAFDEHVYERGGTKYYLSGRRVPYNILKELLKK